MQKKKKNQSENWGKIYIKLQLLEFEMFLSWTDSIIRSRC